MHPTVNSKTGYTPFQHTKIMLGVVRIIVLEITAFYENTCNIN